MEPVLIFIVFLGIMIALAMWGYIQAQRRKQELSDWARKLNFQFDPNEDYGFDTRYTQFSCLRQGSNRYAYNRIEGRRNDRPILAFDYHYETYSTDSKGHRQTHHHYFSAVIVHTDLPLKPLLIREESFFDKLTEFVGFDDIDFESNEFSRSFYVKSPDKKWAYDVIHQKTMEFLLNAPRFTLEFSGREIIAYRGRTFSTTDFEHGILVIEELLALLPDYLLRELREAY